MKIRILSDVHTEFHQDGGKAFIESLDPTDVDVLVLAGDISNVFGIANSLEMFVRRFPCPVLYVPGNHEYYGGSRPKFLKEIKKVSAVDWLHDSIAAVPYSAGKQQRFLGATLWFAHTDESERAEQHMNDFFQIERFRDWVYKENAETVKWLKSALLPGDVVITHHLPSPRSTPARFLKSPIQCFFVTDLTDLIRERKPKLWIHGHTHDSMDYDIGDCRVVCNPMGYVGHATNLRFDPNFTVEI